MKKAPQTGMRVSTDTLAKIKTMAKADNRSATNYIENLVDREYKSQGGLKMKRTNLRHDDEKGFILVDTDGKFITTVNAGEGEEPDWELIEKQANTEGYTLA